MELYKKARPSELSEIAGNKELKESLLNVLKSENKPHVYMFTGCAGCGKTTLALIASQMLGVTNPMNLYDINASDSNGVDDVRELNRVMAVHSSQPRAFIIDEAQKFTEQAWSALLKTMEAPLDNTYIFFCTTNPEQICGTKPEMHRAVMSRCTQFEVEPLDIEEMFTLLQSINETEKLGVEGEVIFAIAKVSEGISRHAIQLLSSVVGMDKETALVRLSKADTVMETIEERNADIFALCKQIALTANGWGEVKNELKTLRDNKKNAETLRIMLLRFASSCLLNANAVNPRLLAIAGCFNTPYYDASTAWSMCIIDCAKYFNQIRR